MIILGIDPGTARMGYSILDISKGKKARLVHTDVVITPKEHLMQDRLRFLYRALKDVSKKYVPDIMVIERLFFNMNAKTAIHVGQARGIALLVAADKKMQVFEYTALEAKQVLTGYGRADKKAVQSAVKDYLKLDDIVKSDDANDAVAIALCFVNKGYPTLL